MGRLCGGKIISSGPPRPKVGSAPVRVRRAALSGKAAEEGLPSTTGLRTFTNE